MIRHRAHHRECAFRLVAPSNVLEDKDVAARGQFGLLRIDGLGCVAVHAVGRAHHKKRKRRSGALGAQYGGVELDAIAHRNHRILARVCELVEGKRLSADFAGMAGAVLGDAIEAGNISFRGADELQGEGKVERREAIFGLRDEFNARAARRFHEQPRAVGGNRPDEIGVVVVFILSRESGKPIRGNLELLRLRLGLRNRKREHGQKEKRTKTAMRESLHVE